MADLHCLALGLPGPDPGPIWPLSPRERDQAGRLLAALGVGEHQRLVALHPGAGLAERCWPLESFAQVGRDLAARGLRVLITGGPREMELTRRLAAQVGEPALDLGGRTDLPGLAAILARCVALISNDSGPVHLAGAVGTPVVSIVLAQGNFRATGPYLPGSLALSADLDCVPCAQPLSCPHRDCHACISPADALAGLELVLGGAWQRPSGSRARFHRARRGEDGWLEWESLTHPGQDRVLAALRRSWLSLLRPGGNGPRPPALPPRPPARPALARLDRLAQEAQTTLTALGSCLGPQGDPASCRPQVENLARLEGEIMSLGRDHTLLRPLVLYQAGRQAGLDKGSAWEQVHQQNDLYLQLRVLVRKLDVNLSTNS